ncbi:hypothetical protein GW17_00006716 [Ensete ventricosum]|nr:hypothetical protein GW17_00006716 [Ensete ventricosum]
MGHPRAIAACTHGQFFSRAWRRNVSPRGEKVRGDCSSIRGCAAKKHVERCLEDPSMLVVTYEGEHNHTKFHTQSTQT